MVPIKQIREPICTFFKQGTNVKSDIKIRDKKCV